MSSTPTHYRIEIGLRLTIERDGAPVPLSPFQEAVLMALAVSSRRGVERERLISLVWDEDDGSGTRQRLRQILYSLGQKAGRELVQATGTHLALRSEAEVVWIAGATEYRCPIESGTFEHWLDGVRVEAGRKREAELSSAFQHLVSISDWAGLTQLANDWVAEFPHSGRAARSLTDATKAAATRKMTRKASVEPPIVGREMEIARVSRVLKEATTVLLHGEAGIGKTRLAREVQARLLAEGVEVFWVDCGAQSRMDFGPLPDLLRTALTEVDVRRSRSPALEDLYYRGANTSSRPLQSLIDGVVAGFGLVSEFDPVVVVVDDFHVADPFTNASIPSVAAACENCTFLLVARPVEATGRDPIAVEAEPVLLGPLSPEAVRELWRLLGSERPISPDRLEGNPLLALELMRRNHGALERTEDPSTAFDGLVRALGPEAAASLYLVRQEPGISISEAAVDLGISYPIAAGHMQTLVDLGLIVRQSGYRIRHAVFEEVSDRVIRDEIRQAIHERLASRLRDSPERLIDFLYHDAASDSRSDSCSEALRLAQAAKLGVRPNQQERLARVATLSDDRSVSAEGHMLLGELLIATRSARRARSHMEKAVELSDRGTSIARRSETLLLALEAQLGLRDAYEAFQVLVNRLDLSQLRTLADFDALEHCVRLAERAGRPESARQIISSLPRHQLELETDAWWQVLMLRALHVVFGDPIEGLDAARQALDLAKSQQNGEHELRSAHRLFIGLMYQGLGDSEEARTTLHLLAEGHDAIPDRRWRYTAIANQAVWLLDTGRYSSASERLLEAAETIRGMDAPDEQLNLLVNNGELALKTGDHTTAFELFTEARRVATPGARRFLSDVISAGLGISSLAIGRVALARKQTVHSDPTLPWTADLTLPSLFVVGRVLKKGRVQEALGVLSQCQNAAIRFVPQRLYLMREEQRIREQFDLRDDDLDKRTNELIRSTELTSVAVAGAGRD